MPEFLKIDLVQGLATQFGLLRLLYQIVGNLRNLLLKLYFQVFKKVCRLGKVLV